jgi:hypothetical protein
MQPSDLEAHFLAQVGIQVGERLIQQQHLRLDHDRACERDALLLAARQFCRVTRRQVPHMHDVEHLADAPAHLLARSLRSSSPNATFCSTVMFGHTA